ncbi:annexin A10-like isoform X1 [Chiloscyllium plagiosum]|uniref:annexin A10-like isoform X1 n=1 Tax=Chiloscyllium plagiosum TaxID=36176 RepID=UPI001CB82964|nr:annexin A10-like isoform X1 [Chiloscyllium plagiosum]
MYCGQMNQGTIFPAADFNPAEDAEVLFSALQGMECNKDDLIEVLTQRCNAQRLIIAQIYSGSYGQDLVTDLKEKLSDHFKEVMVGLMYPPAFFDAHELRHAMKGAGTDENCLIEILASRTNSEIYAINEVYMMQFGVPLQEDIDSETSGHFRDTLMILAQGAREEGYEYEDPAMAAEDATILWDACQGESGEHKNMLQDILCRKSYQQLWMVIFLVAFQQFQLVSGQDIVDVIRDCYDGHFQQLLIAIILCVRDKASYFAYKLNSAIYDFGFHNKTVIRILISRSELDLMNIKRSYKEQYGNSLHHDIRQYASGHYEAALSAICTGDAEDY